MKRYSLAVLATLLWGMLAAPVTAERLVVPLLDESPDGGQALWLRGAATGTFVDPSTGKAAAPATMARVVATKDTLFVGVVGGGDPDKAEFSIRLYPRAAFVEAVAEAPGGEGEGEDDGEDAEEPPLWPPDRPIRFRATSDGAEGGESRVQARPGGFTMEFRVPIPQEVSPRAGDMWLLSMSRGSAVWSVAPRGIERQASQERRHRGLGKLFFGRDNLLDNGDMEEWADGAPKGWTAEDPEGKKARTVRERDHIFSGASACRISYRGSATLAHGRSVALRSGASYALSFALQAGPDQGTEAEIELDLNTGKRRRFAAPEGPAYVTMPFVAGQEAVRPKIIVHGDSGSVILDDIRLEMALDDAPDEARP